MGRIKVRAPGRKAANTRRSFGQGKVSGRAIGVNIIETLERKNGDKIAIGQINDRYMVAIFDRHEKPKCHAPFIYDGPLARVHAYRKAIALRDN